MSQTMKKRAIRPIDRQRMRPWLVNLLNNNSVDGLAWRDRERETFQVTWRHGSRHGWSRKDADVFERWAMHTGKFREGETPDPKKWKANFRCALNSLPDINEEKNLSNTKGNNAYRVYKMAKETKSDKKSSNRNANKHNRIIEEMTSDGEESRSSTGQESPQRLTPSNNINTYSIPDFSQISSDQSIKKSHMVTLSATGHCGGGIVCVNEESSPVETFYLKNMNQYASGVIPSPAHSLSDSSSSDHSYRDTTDAELSDISRLDNLDEDEFPLMPTADWTDLQFFEDEIGEPAVVTITNYNQEDLQEPTAISMEC
ncbi:interferon regulatory factor 2 isoform X2 [Patella vulgata]|nr:interferon regulatory factor 2 isoform X2 [Patella vulgata]